jgi:RNA polymerase subunit RPABC4/transcription elongation factor Spt4
MPRSINEQHAVVPFVECPNCERLLEYGAQMCPRCREEIDPGYALVSSVVVHHSTQACAVANTIKTFDPFAYIAIPLSAVMYLIDTYAVGQPALFYFVPAWPLIPLLFILVWFKRYAPFLTGDAELARARRELRGSLLLWLAILAVQVVALLRMRG